MALAKIKGRSTKRKAAVNEQTVFDKMLAFHMASQEKTERMVGSLAEMLKTVVTHKNAEAEPGYERRYERESMAEEIEEVGRAVRELREKGLTVKMEPAGYDKHSLNPKTDHTFNYLIGSYVYSSEEPVHAVPLPPYKPKDHHPGK